MPEQYDDLESMLAEGDAEAESEDEAEDSPERGFTREMFDALQADDYETFHEAAVGLAHYCAMADAAPMGGPKSEKGKKPKGGMTIVLG